MHRGVAQFGRALRSGRRGRKFKSCRLDQVKAIIRLDGCLFSFMLKGLRALLFFHSILNNRLKKHYNTPKLHMKRGNRKGYLNVIL